MKYLKFLLVLVLPLLLSNCFSNEKKNSTDVIASLYKRQVDSLLSEVDILVALAEKRGSEETLRHQFGNARKAYKKVEWLTEYFFGYTSKFINGPALEEVEADEKSIVIQPEGFQVVEELLFPRMDETKRNELNDAIKILRSNIVRLKMLSTDFSITDSQIFDALRLEVFRIVSLGLSGFDSPIANQSIAETAAALESLHQNYLLFSSASTPLQDSHNSIGSFFSLSKEALHANYDFNSFDRGSFIAKYMMPLVAALVNTQRTAGIPFQNEPRLLYAEADNLFTAKAYNSDFFSPDLKASSSSQKVALGKQLFYDGVLSGNGKRSCASCHRPEKAFADGQTFSTTLDGRGRLQRNTPTLINAALQPALFYDTRLNYLEDQAADVVKNRDEMHGDFEKAVSILKQNRNYLKQFNTVYNTSVITATQIQNAIAAYIRSLVAMNSRFDRFMRGENNAINNIEKKGFNLFMGKAKCGTCHFLPLFNGSAPPYFDKIDAEVIGVPASADTIQPIIDGDKGKYNLYKIALHKNAFKTPTLRNIALTAPYMHNGVYNTLDEVIDFYNKGGGVGLGLTLTNQTLPSDPLNLTQDEKKSLISFLHTLNDTVITR